jgi:predicted nucleotidyltransferase
MMNTCESIRQKREAILEIARHHGASNVRIFGSVARGDATENSDIDLLVRFNPSRSLFDHGGLIVDLEELLGVKVDVVSEAGMRDRFRDEVAREAVPL